MCTSSVQSATPIIEPHSPLQDSTCKQECDLLQMTMTMAMATSTTTGMAEATTATDTATTTTMVALLQLLQQLLVEALQLQQLLPADQQMTEQDAVSIVKATWDAT